MTLTMLMPLTLPLPLPLPMTIKVMLPEEDGEEDDEEDDGEDGDDDTAANAVLALELRLTMPTTKEMPKASNIARISKSAVSLPMSRPKDPPASTPNKTGICIPTNMIGDRIRPDQIAS